MTPPEIVRAAMLKGLAMIAVCDHNSAGNAAATQEAAGGDIAVIAGIELTTVEEVHVLGLFASAEAASAAADEVRAVLPPATDADRRFGEQRLFSARGEIIGLESKMLGAATSFRLSESVGLIRRHDGLVVAAHINRPSFSVLSQLGMFPEDVRFDAIEVFPVLRGTACRTPTAETREPDWPRLPVLHSSDGHFLSDIGKCHTMLELAGPTFEELALALRGLQGRSVCDA